MNEFPQRAWVEELLVEFVPHNPFRALFLFQGLPSVPCDSGFLFYLAERFNVSVFYPRYPGTWESKGLLDELLPSLNKLMRKRIFQDCYTGEKYSFSFKRRFGIGHSFGGMVVLKLLEEEKLDAGVALAAPWEINNLKDHLGFVKRCFGEAYRFKHPKLFSIDPTTIKQLPHLLIYSKDDEVVPLKEVEPFIQGLNVRIVDGYGHGGKRKLIKRYSRTIARLFSDG
ncbi:MAG: hypothetical protein GXN92_01585 [Candidatus Micrarchaeota archaeon]|nr:hypothetical protein [Candidatus Micrarchaeota archaeon]